MPLIDLKSDLTNLKFGNDRPGGGNSGLPYIKTYLPQNDSAAAQLGIAAGKYSIDFPIRGGAKAVTNAVTDTLRITKFFGDLQRGPFFIAKQIGLQLSNPRTEVGAVLGNTPYTQVYVPTNTLASVAVQGSGIHWDRPGLVPSTPDQLKYAYVVGQQVVTNSGKTNRLLTLYSSKIKPGSAPIDPLIVKKLGIDSKSPLNLFKYSNGPETTYGIGETIIPRFESTTPASSSVAAYPYLYGARPNLAQVPNYKSFITASDAYMSQSGDVFSLGYVDSQGSASLNNIGQQTKSTLNNFTKNKYPTNFRLVTGSKPVLDYTKYTAAQSIFVSESKIQIVSGIEANGQNYIASAQQKTVTRNNYESTPYPINYSGSYVRPAKANVVAEPGNALTAYKLYQSVTNPPLQASRSQDILKEADNTFFQTSAGFAYTYDLIKSRGDVAKGHRGQMPQDFRKILIQNRIGGKSLYGYDYQVVNMEKRIGYANSGMTNFDRSKRGNTDSLTQDSVTMTPIQASSTDGLKGGDFRDLVKFVVEAVDNNAPTQTTKIYFRSYINGFTDNHGADWSSFRYTGRGDNFYTYQGFTREVSLQFTLPALSAPEMKRIYQKANYLASLCYPNYNSAGLMRGNITLLTVGDYLYRTPGILKSVNITIPDDSAWEIAMNQPEGDTADSLMYELPQMLKISLAFTPIMSILPRRGAGVPLITPASKNNRFLGEVASII